MVTADGCPESPVPITPPVWDLYACAVRLFGPTPTVIEWDNDLPPLSTLIAEASRADAVLQTERTREPANAIVA